MAIYSVSVNVECVDDVSVVSNSSRSIAFCNWMSELKYSLFTNSLSIEVLLPLWHTPVVPCAMTMLYIALEPCLQQTIMAPSKDWEWVVNSRHT